MVLNTESRHWCTWCFVRMVKLKTSKRCVAWHIYYYIPASFFFFFFVPIKAQKCFTIRLVLFNQNVSMKVLCIIFLFFVFHQNEPNIFCFIFSFRNALFLCVQFVVFRLTLWFGLHRSPHYLRRKNVQVLFHC